MFEYSIYTLGGDVLVISLPEHATIHDARLAIAAALGHAPRYQTGFSTSPLTDETDEKNMRALKDDAVVRVVAGAKREVHLL